MKLLKRLFQEEEGVTMVEYGLIAALIAVAAIAFLPGVGNAVAKAFKDVLTAMGGDPGTQ